MRRVRAVVFGFDGLILDTESPVFEAWRTVHTEAGHTLPLARWLQHIGTDGAGFDPVGELRALTGGALDVDAMHARRDGPRSYGLRQQ